MSIDEQIAWETKRIRATLEGCLMLRNISPNMSPEEKAQVDSVMDLIVKTSRMQTWGAFLLWRQNTCTGQA